MTTQATAHLTNLLGDEITDAEDETFLLFATRDATLHLGFVDREADSVEVNVNGTDITVHQSLSLLSSSRAGGTTGAVLWSVNPRFANWLSSRQASRLLSFFAPETALELGCGISALNAFALRFVVKRYLLSDQGYVHKLLARNMTAASLHTTTTTTKQKPKAAEVLFRPLDWETDAVTKSLCAPAPAFDLVVASDCIFNESLVPHFVQTCYDAS
ncbi:Calcium-binding protein [Ophiocordyceps camponoti-floridani]|uniref:Calcium-binding protein n=1 Tax=Ophiocordyceps camponoti-floridani TaxID=2030778 RepID=A0A8H4Q607_9HYPO|nr:Calcium-binding protein [Ophiocordyceps camponoti-floridani]